MKKALDLDEVESVCGREKECICTNLLADCGTGYVAKSIYISQTSNACENECCTIWKTSHYCWKREDEESTPLSCGSWSWWGCSLL